MKNQRVGRRRFARRFRFLAFGFLFLLPQTMAAQAATALETARLGPLSDIVSLKLNGAWSAEVADGFYILENRTRAGSIRFFYLGPRYPGAGPVEVGHRVVSVRVRVDADRGDNLGGLLYGYRPDPLFYYAFGLDGEGQAVLYRRNAEGIHPVLSTTLPTGPSHEGVVSIEERGREIVLRVNGTEVGRLTGEGTGEGGTGILALGRGRFGFREFSLRAAGEALAEAGGTGPATPPAQPPTSSPTPAPQKPTPTTTVPSAPKEPPAPPSPPPAPQKPTGTAAERFGPLARIVKPGRTDVWEYGPEKDGFVLHNREGQDRILRFTAPTPDIEGRRMIRLEFSMDGDAGTQGAGIAYGDTGEQLFLLLWTPDNQVLLERYDGSVIVPLRAWQIEEANTPTHRLWLAEDGDIVAVGFGGGPLGFVQNPLFGKGKVGIFAYGTGTFRFTRFKAEPLNGDTKPLPLPETPEAQQPTPTGPPPEPPQPPQPPGPYGQQAPQQPGPYGQQAPQQPGPWGQPQPGPWGQPPQPPGPYGQQQPQPGPWGQQPPQQPGPWGQQQPGPWGQPPQPPGPYGQQPPQQPGPWGQPQPGPWGQPPQPPGPYGQQPPQPGPWGQPQGQPVPQAPRAPFDQKATDRAVGDILRLARTLPDVMVETKPRPAPRAPKGWKRYVDPAVATVSVNHPAGWQVQAVAQPSGYGALPAYANVRVTSPDGLHRMVARSGFGAQQQAADPVEAVQGLLDELAGDEAGQELLREENFTSNVSTPGLPPAEGVFRAVRSGDYIVVAYAAALNMPAAGAYSTLVRARAVAGPADRFADMTAKVYLPLLNSTIAW